MFRPGDCARCQLVHDRDVIRFPKVHTGREYIIVVLVDLCRVIRHSDRTGKPVRNGRHADADLPVRVVVSASPEDQPGSIPDCLQVHRAVIDRRIRPVYLMDIGIRHAVPASAFPAQLSDMDRISLGEIYDVVGDADISDVTGQPVRRSWDLIKIVRVCNDVNGRSRMLDRPLLVYDQLRCRIAHDCPPDGFGFRDPPAFDDPDAAALPLVHVPAFCRVDQLIQVPCVAVCFADIPVDIELWRTGGQLRQRESQLLIGKKSCGSSGVACADAVINVECCRRAPAGSIVIISLRRIHFLHADLPAVIRILSGRRADLNPVNSGSQRPVRECKLPPFG